MESQWWPSATSCASPGVPFLTPVNLFLFGFRQPSPSRLITAFPSQPSHGCRSPKHSKPVVAITHCGDSGYWLVTITCKDRSKLLFDTVCTLADLDYDVYHATIDSNDGVAQQEYYVKPRLGRTGEANLDRP